MTGAAHRGYADTLVAITNRVRFSLWRERLTYEPMADPALIREHLALWDHTRHSDRWAFIPAAQSTTLWLVKEYEKETG